MKKFIIFMLVFLGLVIVQSDATEISDECTLPEYCIPEECVTEEYVYVQSIFIYDFEGWLTRVGEETIDERPGKDCGDLSISCAKVHDLFICACHNNKQRYGDLMAIVQDKTNK